MTTSSHMEVNNAQTFGDSWALGQVWVSSSPPSILPLPSFLFLSRSFTPLQLSVAVVIYVCFSPLSPLWYLRVIRHSITFSMCVCVCVLCVSVWKWLCSRATMWRGLRQTAVCQEGVCSPLQRCLCTLSQRGECHWTDAHTHTHKCPYKVNAAIERLSCLRQGSRGQWGVMGTTPNWSQRIHCSSETNTKYHSRCKGTHSTP